MMLARRGRRPPPYDGCKSGAAAAVVVKVIRWGQVAAAAHVMGKTGAAAAATAMRGSRQLYWRWRRPPLYDGCKAWAATAPV